jgi:hypothetical protein
MRHEKCRAQPKWHALCETQIHVRRNVVRGLAMGGRGHGQTGFGVDERLKAMTDIG